jgi:hypothetical protein
MVRLTGNWWPALAYVAVCRHRGERSAHQATADDGDFHHEQRGDPEGDLGDVWQRHIHCWLWSNYHIRVECDPEDARLNAAIAVSRPWREIAQYANKAAVEFDSHRLTNRAGRLRFDAVVAPKIAARIRAQLAADTADH